MATGCIVEDAPPRGTGYVHSEGGSTGEGGAGAGGDDIAEGECDDGEIRECKVQINKNNCFVGEQICEAGQWSECLDPEDIDHG
jgi:hypothetical protein